MRPNWKKDLEHLKFKLDQGADFVITQLFFKPEYYFKFVERARGVGIEAPIIPGIMPISSYNNFRFMRKTFESRMPQELLNQIYANRGDKSAVRQIGLEHAIKTVEELQKFGVKGIHFYTSNCPRQVSRIMRELNDSNITDDNHSSNNSIESRL